MTEYWCPDCDDLLDDSLCWTCQCRFYPCQTCQKLRPSEEDAETCCRTVLDDIVDALD